MRLRKVRHDHKGRTIGTLLVRDNNNDVSVVKSFLKGQKDFITGVTEKCWNAHKHTEGLLNRNYYLNHLFEL